MIGGADRKREKSLAALCEIEGLDREAISKVIEDYNFTGRTPLRERIVSSLEEKPKILERKTIVERVTEKLMNLIKTFDDDIGAV